jgi:hypothetical protein
MGFLGVYSFFGAFFDRRGTEETEVTEVFLGRVFCPLPEMGFLGVGNFDGGGFF